MNIIYAQKIKLKKGKVIRHFVQVNTQIFMMCPLSVLVLGNFCDEKSA